MNEIGFKDMQMQLQAQFVLIAAMLKGARVALNGFPAHSNLVRQTMLDEIDMTLLNTLASDEAIQLARTVIEKGLPAQQ